MILIAIGMFLAALWLLTDMIRAEVHEEIRSQVQAKDNQVLRDSHKLARRYGALRHHWKLFMRVEKHYQRAKRNDPDHQCTYRGNLEAIRQGIRYERSQIED